MIKHLKHTEINKKKWDACIQRSFNGIIYAYSWYLDIVCKNWEALVEDDYRSVMPLTVGKKYNISYLYQPYFTQQLGVFSMNKLTEAIVKSYLKAIPNTFKFMEINLNTFNLVHSMEYSIKRNLTHELDLINSYENHYAFYSENTKRNIKKARKNQLEISKNTEPKKIIKMFREHRGKSIEKLKTEHYGMVGQLMEACMVRNKGQVWGVYTKEEELCAGAFFVESNGKVIFLFSAANDEAKRAGAISFLIDRFIFENSQRNLTLDFEGSNEPSLARFYKSFGSKECVYLQVRKNNLPPLIKWLKK